MSWRRWDGRQRSGRPASRSGRICPDRQCRQPDDASELRLTRCGRTSEPTLAGRAHRHFHDHQQPLRCALSFAPDLPLTIPGEGSAFPATKCRTRRPSLHLHHRADRAGHSNGDNPIARQPAEGGAETKKALSILMLSLLLFTVVAPAMMVQAASTRCSPPCPDRPWSRSTRSTSTRSWPSADPARDGRQLQLPANIDWHPKTDGQVLPDRVDRRPASSWSTTASSFAEDLTRRR